MPDKDGEFLDNLTTETHAAWRDGLITNTLRSWLLDSIQELRDRL